MRNNVGIFDIFLAMFFSFDKSCRLPFVACRVCRLSIVTKKNIFGSVALSARSFIFVSSGTLCPFSRNIFLFCFFFFFHLLIDFGVISTPAVEDAFRQVDRAFFVPPVRATYCTLTPRLSAFCRAYCVLVL